MMRGTIPMWPEGSYKVRSHESRVRDLHYGICRIFLFNNLRWLFDGGQESRSNDCRETEEKEKKPAELQYSVLYMGCITHPVKYKVLLLTSCFCIHLLDDGDADFFFDFIIAYLSGQTIRIASFDTAGPLMITFCPLKLIITILLSSRG